MTLPSTQAQPSSKYDYETLARHSFVWMMISVIFFQKFGIRIGKDTIPLALPGAYLIIAYLVMKGAISIEPVRLILFSIYFCLGWIGLAMNPSASPASFFLVAGLAFTFVFRLPVSNTTFRWCMRCFVAAMMLTGPVVLVEWGLQIIFGPGMWVNLESIVPPDFLVPGFMYRHPTSFQSPWMQPNAAVFLEVSILSQLLAIAFMIELSYFCRPACLAILSSTMLITLGGSGPFLMTLSLPFLIVYTPPRLLVPGFLFASILLLLLSTTTVFSDFSGRVFEYQNPQSSSYGRFVVPFELIKAQLTADGGVFYGRGPGTGDAAGAGFPLGKLLYEYGVLATVSYYALFIAMLFGSGQPPLVVWALFVFFSFLGGGLGVPFYPLACVTLGGLFSRTKPAKADLRAQTPLAAQ